METRPDDLPETLEGDFSKQTNFFVVNVNLLGKSDDAQCSAATTQTKATDLKAQGQIPRIPSAKLSDSLRERDRSK